jgi:hypothetical protein
MFSHFFFPDTTEKVGKQSDSELGKQSLLQVEECLCPEQCNLVKSFL